MKGKKTDIKLKAKIIEAKINKDAQGSDIAQELGIPERTVQNILQAEFAEICGKSDAVANLITRNDNLQSSADKLLQKLLDEWKEVRASDLVSIRESAFKQNQLLTWGKTENLGVTVISEEEQKNLLKLLWK